MLPKAFETPRLIARMPEAADAARLFATYTQRPEVCRYVIWRPHKHVSETEAFVSECLSAIESGARLPFVLCERGEPLRPIGMLDAHLSRHNVDIGYVLAPELA